MRRQILSVLGAAAATAVLLLATTGVMAGPGGRPGPGGGGRPGPGPGPVGRPGPGAPGFGPYRGPGYAPYYRGGFGYGFGVGVGLGFGLYAPYYGSYAAFGYGYDPYLAYPPAVIVNSSASPTLVGAADTPSNDGSRQADDKVHLKLIVPEGAEVWIGGVNVPGKGTEREFASPPLKPNKKYLYAVRVVSTEANGKVNDETRQIHFRANDWFAVDFTKPEPSRKLPAPREEPVDLER